MPAPAVRRSGVVGLSGRDEQLEIIPGDPQSSVVLHVPHASTRIPDDVRAGIVLDDAALAAELDAITDADTDVVAEQAAGAAQVRPWIFVNRRSRLVIDPERFIDGTEELDKVGMGAVYTRTTSGAVLRDPTAAERQRLLDEYFVPYAAAIASLVQERLATVGGVTIVDVHSYPREALPYELHTDGPRPEICIGTDVFHTPPAVRDAALESMTACAPTGAVGLDSPFWGCYVPLEQYGNNADVRALMLEVRRDVVAGHRPALVAGVKDLLNRLDTGQRDLR